MPCDSTARTPAEQEEREDSLDELGSDITSGRRRLKKNAKGELSVDGWEKTRAARSGWCDGCALSALATKGSWLVQAALRQQGVSAGKSFQTVGHGHPHTPRKR